MDSQHGGHGIRLQNKDFDFFRQTLYDLAGISLSGQKIDLVQSRLRSRPPALGMTSFDEYKTYLQKLPADHSEWQLFINLLTTNKTDFFREPEHFELLKNQFLPGWKKNNELKLKVWSAACSTGEEPYTLSMILGESLLPERDFTILATDIDTDVLAKASNGVYSRQRVTEQIPEPHLKRSVNFGTDGIEKWARIKPALRDRVIFKQHNLIENTTLGDETFDLIFLRNVLIYFSPEAAEFVVAKLFRAAKPGALLLIGHSETLNGIPTQWGSVTPSVYEKNR